ncbi:HDOD domain-containing protein [Myxococcota bacterium]|nr:HDOD domain-containing protein [Myxococcota bacterium]
MFEWLFELFGRGAVQTEPVHEVAPSPPRRAEPVRRSEPTAEPDDAASKELAVHERLRSLLDQLRPHDASAAASVPAAPVAPSERVRVACERVFDHFRKHQEDYPGFPSIAMHLFALVEKPDVDVRELVRVVGQDPIVSARVLQVANSAYYSTGQEVASLREAIIRLGTKQIARIAAQAATRAVFDIEERAGYELFEREWSREWTHAMTTSLGAGWLTSHVSGTSADRVQLGGLLHDIGKTIALRSLASLVMRGEVDRPDEREVAEILEATHVDLGVEMATTWMLPEFVIRVCEEHHEVPDGDDAKDILVVSVVSGLVALWHAPHPRQDLEREVLAAIQALSLDHFVIRALLNELKTFEAAVQRMDAKNTA